MNTTAHSGSKRRKKPMSLERKEELQGYLFVLPWIIGFLLFTAGPLLFSFYVSFTNYDFTSQMDFVGLRNYKYMFHGDPLFWVSLKNTLFYVVLMVPLTTFASIALASILNQKIPGIRVFRTIYYLPSVLSGVGVYMLWMELLSPDTGIVNLVLSWFGITGPGWMFDPNWTKPAIVMMKMWSVGGGMLMYLAALQGVPEQLYEAAEIDGAGSLRRFWHITMPLISPVIFFEVITTFISGFQIFQEGYVMSSDPTTPGSPMNSLLFFNLHMYLKAFKVFQMGYASAMAWFLFVVVLFITMINMWVSKYWVHYEGGDGR
ncbi:carbohydrate ABC transporter membrane protein 1 (CUT1 family) [Paenibacillus taihuensis]|uniref:Carbohydrate ABC transporter membrane protein 1 (CUT1 family) n=1 Tax=Paenibacillus taihuensis TaxID=1156355 RepID=A0A3D9SC80_9BACL|nr:sugar ABC transporter permease [Paenibacillus taihuensis]REE86126.1 carbohydrate ABC transporter membrane protein 1 (CUT1 family) [Paenibacillus taihuensis]